MTALEYVGKAAGLVDATLAVNDMLKNPTPGKIAEATFKTAMISIKANRVVNFVLAVADLTELTDFFFNW